MLAHRSWRVLRVKHHLVEFLHFLEVLLRVLVDVVCTQTFDEFFWHKAVLQVAFNQIRQVFAITNLVVVVFGALLKSFYLV